jgi:hypothetical protein
MAIHIKENLSSLSYFWKQHARLAGFFLIGWFGNKNVKALEKGENYKKKMKVG